MRRWVDDTAAAGWRSRRALVMLLLGAVALVALGLATGEPTQADRSRDVTYTDNDLYTDVMREVAAGRGYHDAAIEAQREHSYPVKPFVTVREPTLAHLGARIGGLDGLQVAFGVVLLLVLLSAMVRLDTLTAGRAWILGTVAFGLTAATALAPGFAISHEAWAMLLVCGSLFTWRADRWWPSVLLGVLALFVRELALGYAVAMLATALLAGRRREAAAWLGGILAWAPFLAWHASEVAERVRPGDLESPGWSSLGGWSFILATARDSTALQFLPLWVTAVLVPVALWGWAARTGAVPRRATLVLLGYVAAFCVVGRPENSYWGYLYVPLLVAGLAFVPGAVGRTARSPRRLTTGEKKS